MKGAFPHVRKAGYAALLVGMSLYGCSKGGGEKSPQKAAGGAAAARPVMASAVIYPSQPASSDSLRCEATANDPGGLPVTYLHKWSVNGQEVPEPGGTLSPDHFKKKDHVSVTVTPSNGKTQGTPLISEAVVIGNSPPAVSGATLQPQSPAIADILTIIPAAQDPDGDNVTFSYKWFRNGQEVPGQVSAALPLSSYKKGDLITMVVTPSDGEADGPPFLPAQVRISNSPPRITSSPPDSLGQDGGYTYQLVAADPDGDPLAFSLTKAPSGMTIDPRSGLIQWRPTKDQGGPFDVEVVAEDGGGGRAAQKYTVTLSFQKPTP